MADLNDGSTEYPENIDTYTEEGAGESTDRNPVNGSGNACVAIQGELGTNPAGSLATVKARLAINLNNDGSLKNIQTVYTIDGSVSASLTTNIDFDTGIPQNVEGEEVFTQAITPVNTSNILTIDAIIMMSAAAADHCIVALFQDTTAPALRAAAVYAGGADQMVTVHCQHIMAAGTVAATTFKVRIGGAAQNVVMNGVVGPAVRLGGVATSLLRITESEG